MNKMTLYSLLTVFLLIMAIIFLGLRNNRLNDKYDIAIQNNKAYEAQIGNLQEENRVFQFSVSQLEYMNDSTIKVLDSTRKALQIKDRQLQQMSKIKEKIYVHDSIVTHDTIFSKPDFVLDTCLGDKWYQNCLHMEYPNQISSQMSINTDLSCFIHSSRETINPPRKTWIGRLFQKKHTVINVTVKENNPYSNITESKFIKIIDK